MNHKENNQKTSEIKKIMFGVIIVSLLVGTVAGGIAGSAFSYFGINYLTKTPLVGKTIQNQIIKKTKVEQLQEQSATIEAVKKVSPAVVSIIISKDLSKYYRRNDIDFFPFDDFFDFDIPESRPQKKGKQEIGGGTGFIVDGKKGLILTNKHVVADEEAEYSVITNDGKRYDSVKVLAKDPINDLAVLKIEATDLPEISFGDSDSVEIGQTVIAIGFALGEYKNTVTKGIISGRGRTIFAGGSNGSESLEDVLQTDAAINPGNSGGPLVDLHGNVIGINTAISREGQLIGFAIPINECKSVYESVRDTGKISRAFLGVRYVLLNDTIVKKNNLKVDHGALIVRGRHAEELAVIPGGPADKAGLVENDIILEVDGQKIDQKHNLRKIIGRHKPGDEVIMKVYHKGKEKTVKVKLEERKID